MYNELSKLLSTGDKNALAELIEYYCENASVEERQNLALYAEKIRDEVYGARVFLEVLLKLAIIAKMTAIIVG